VSKPTVPPAGPARYGAHGSSLRDLPRLRSARRRRESSWDRSGGNRDYLALEPGASKTLCELEGAGCITHIWITAGALDFKSPATPERQQMMRRLVLGITWDGGEHPSVLTPLGDFFGIGHARTANFVSLPLQMSPEDGRGLNSFFQMPFSEGARIEIRSEMESEDVMLYFYVDYESYDFSTRISVASTPAGTARTRPPAPREGARATRSSSSPAPTSTAPATT